MDTKTIIVTLVTDRTQADVERVRELAAKGFSAMTSDEQAEWLAGMKGAYNASDLNRVGTALNYLAGRLASNLREEHHVDGENRLGCHGHSSSLTGRDIPTADTGHSRRACVSCRDAGRAAAGAPDLHRRE